MIQRILLIDADLMRDEKSDASVYFAHHPIGLLYLVSAAKAAYPHIEFKVFHTATSKDPVGDLESLSDTFEPDMVGIRSLSIAKETFHLIAEKVRQMRPNVPIAGGGPYPSTDYDTLLKTGLIDIAVIGEGEETFTELVGRLQHSPEIPADINGTAVMVEGKVKVNAPRTVIQDLDSIPFPDYNMISLDGYSRVFNHAMEPTSKCAFLLSSRGCPFSCFYCHQLFGRRIRRRSPGNVVAEMRERIEKHGILDFVFLDDIFNVPNPEARIVLKAIIRELPRVRLNFPNGLRADQLDEELLDLFEQAGTVDMALAVETATPRLQKMMGKNLDLIKAEKAIREATKRFVTRIFFMIGFPTETFEEALATIRFAASFEYCVKPALSVVRMYTNSGLFHQLNPTEEQAAQIAEMEKSLNQAEMFKNLGFYGDLFPAEKVPLKSSDLKELIYIWMREVLVNPDRVRKSHQILSKFYEGNQILSIYQGIFNRPSFNERDLQRLLAMSSEQDTQEHIQPGTVNNPAPL